MRKSSILIFILLSFQASARDLCVEKDKTAEIPSEMTESFKDRLDGKNKAVVPPGVPQDNFKSRNLEYVANVRNVALVFLHFKTSDKDKDGFVQPFNYWVEKNKLEPVEVPDLGNGDSRFWRAKAEIGKECGRPRVDVTFDGCLACGDGKNLKGHFDYQVIEKKWTYFSDAM